MRSLLKWAVRALLFVSLLFVLTVLRELYVWYLFFRGIEPWAGYLYAVVATGATAYFVVLPVVRILALPTLGRPETATDPRRRRRALVRRARLLGCSREVARGDEAALAAFIQTELAVRQPLAAELRRRHVAAVFAGTAVSQSAVIDLYVVVSAALRVVWKTFEIYGGRVPLRDTLRVFRDIAMSGALGASAVAEAGGDAMLELTGQLGLKTLSKLPFSNLAAESLADGYVNAYLVCRIALTTENFCTHALAESPAHWRPNAKAASQATWDVLRESQDFIRMKLGPVLGRVFGWILRAETPAAAPDLPPPSDTDFWQDLKHWYNRWRSRPETT